MNYAHLPQFLFTEEEFNNKSKCAQCKIKCLNCGEVFIRTKDRLLPQFNSIGENSKFKDLYLKQIQCCSKCKNVYSPTHIMVDCECGYCHKKFQRLLTRVKDTKTNLQFCCQKCSRMYYSKNDIARQEWTEFEHTNPNGNFLFTKEDYDKVKGPKSRLQKLLPVKCLNCENTFYTSAADVKDFYCSAVHGVPKTNNLRFCSQKCFGESCKTGKELICDMCGKTFYRKLSEYNVERKYGKVFCSHECSQNFLYTSDEVRKDRLFWSGSRSKCEKYLEYFLRMLFPDLQLDCCRRDVLNNRLELDLYFPEKKIAIEVNGQYHYRPVNDKHMDDFIKYQQRDKLKRQLCEEKGISLIEINTCDLSTFYFRKANEVVIKPTLDKLRDIMKINFDYEEVNHILTRLQLEHSELITGHYANFLKTIKTVPLTE